MKKEAKGDNALQGVCSDEEEGDRLGKYDCGNCCGTVHDTVTLAGVALA